jgi:hypothetical protein
MSPAKAVVRLVVLLPSLTLAAPSLLLAASFYVTPTGDDTNTCTSPASPCATMNGALGKAAPADTILVAVGTYTATGSQVVLIQKGITLSGGWDTSFVAPAGYSTIDGGGIRRGVEVSTGLAGVVLERFIVENGVGTGFQGGGILNNGNLTVNQCIIRNNQTGGIFNLNVLVLNDSVVSGNFNNFNNSGGGGGIENFAFTTLTVNRTTISGNETTSAGGGLNIGGGTVTLTNSTVSGNVAHFIGGGIANRTDGTLTLDYVTITGNSGLFGGGGIGYEVPATTSLLGTILAGNSGGVSGGGPDCLGSGSMVSRGHNLIGKNHVPPLNDCIVATGGDLVGTQTNPITALLGPLSDNGGPTPTRALLAGSLAIDAGDDAACSAAPVFGVDQRGYSRVSAAGAHCDIGSFEKTSAFTDDPLIAATTPIKAIHVRELRSRINAVRIGRGLMEFPWTDPVLTPGTTLIKAQHIIDLRQALLDVYVAAGRTPPAFSDPILTSGGTVARATHIAELRTALVAIE